MDHPQIRIGIIDVHPDRGRVTTAHIHALQQLSEVRLTTLSHHDPNIVVLDSWFGDLSHSLLQSFINA